MLAYNELNKYREENGQLTGFGARWVDVHGRKFLQRLLVPRHAENRRKGSSSMQKFRSFLMIVQGINNLMFLWTNKKTRFIRDFLLGSEYLYFTPFINAFVVLNFRK
ncbi:MAG TPA: hypothetical protein DCW42_00880 [Bacteroidetes bacterium]|nr:hypothetical protein [Bacteroidota bacterium]